MSMEVPKGYRGKIDAAKARRARLGADADVKAQRQALLIAKFNDESLHGPVHETDLTPPRQHVEAVVHNPLTDAGGFDPNTADEVVTPVVEAVEETPVEETVVATDATEDEVPPAPAKRKKG